MTTRPTRSSSIPIPRSTSSTSPSRNIESLISMPIPPLGRRRLTSSNGSQALMQQRLLDDHGGPGISHGAHGSSSLVATSPTRSVARSFTASSIMPGRGSPRSQPTFEPRVIRADTSRNIDACLPSSSTSPTRNRRPSAAGVRTPSTQRHVSGNVATAPLAPNASFPRPAYLEHSAFRLLLQTEASPSSASTRKDIDTAADIQTFGRRTRGSMSPPTDSDEESNVSPPRDIPPPLPLNTASDHPILRLPTRWDEQVRHPLLSVSQDGRDLTYHGSSPNGEKDAAAARTTYPIPPACGIYYYEVEIISKGQKGHISVGFAARDVKLARLPGWEKNSWGYHGDDGHSFAAEKNGIPYGPKFGTGDVIGCGIDFSTRKAFYTKDGKFIAHVFDDVGKDVDIYPSVGLRHTGEAIRVNFGQDAFKYDIDYHVQQQRNQTWAKILTTPLDSSLLYGRTEENSNGEITPEKTIASEEQIKAPINRLVMSYLAHHGYAKTARAFQAQSERRDVVKVSDIDSADRDVDMDYVPDRSRYSRSAAIDGDIELRTRIVNSVMTGDIDTALSETREHHPSVLEAEEGLMLFKLKCRKFVELILEAAEMKKRMHVEEADHTNYHRIDEEGPSDGMDVDVDIFSPTTISNGFALDESPIKVGRKDSKSHGYDIVGQYETALQQAISYGQTLQTEYKADTRPEVRAIFKRTFGIVAWYDPIGAGGEAADVAGHDARVALANDLNQAILKSQGRPSQPALETLYRQTAACMLQLGLLGVGAAAFADMPKEFLDA